MAIRAAHERLPALMASVTAALSRKIEASPNADSTASHEAIHGRVTPAASVLIEIRGGRS